jgi:putative transposase
MPEYRRTYTPGGTYFFTLVTHERQPILLDAPIRDALRESINQTRARLPFHANAWVLLPDHLHAIWTLPEGDTAYSVRWSLIKQGVSKRCAALYNDDSRRSLSRLKRRESSLWQRRFWEHQIRHETDFERCMDYAHYNPVKHALVSSVIEWPYSTFHRYVNEGVYPADWGSSLEIDGDFGE